MLTARKFGKEINMKIVQVKVSKFVKLLLIAGALAFSASANAGHVWSGDYPLYEVYTHNQGVLFFRMNPISAHPNPAGCVSSSFLRVEANAGNKQELYQMGLTAIAAGLKVQIYIHGTLCSGNYPMVMYMRVRK